MIVASLVVQYLADISNIKSSLTDIKKMGEEIQKSANNIGKEISGVAATMNNAGALLQSSVQMFASVGLLNVGRSVAQLAGRADELQKVMYVTGKNAGYTSTELDRAEKNMRSFGIATNEARSSITKMIQANIGLDKSFQLARAAQDLAVIAGWESSETLQRLIINIQQADTLGLRFMGIILDQSEAQRAFAKETGIVGRELTRQEKTQATLNGVLREAAKLTGAYETAMDSWSKTARSTTRYLADFKVALGKELQEPLLNLERGYQKLLLAGTNMEGSLTKSTGRFLLMGSAVATLFAGFQTLQRGFEWMVGGNEKMAKLIPTIKGVTGALILLSGTETGRRLVDGLTVAISECMSMLSDMTGAVKNDFSDTAKTVTSLLGESVEIGLVGKFLFGLSKGKTLLLMATITAISALLKTVLKEEIDYVKEAEKRKTDFAKKEEEKRSKEIGELALAAKERNLKRELGLDKTFAEIALLNTESQQKKELEIQEEKYRKLIDLEPSDKIREKWGTALRLVKAELTGLTSAWEASSKAIETGLKSGVIRQLELVRNQIDTLEEHLAKFPDTEREILLNNLYEKRKKLLDDLFTSISKTAENQYKLLSEIIDDTSKESVDANKKLLNESLAAYKYYVDKLKTPVYEVGITGAIKELSNTEIYEKMGEKLSSIKEHFQSIMDTATSTLKGSNALQEDMIKDSRDRINKIYEDQKLSVGTTGQTKEEQEKNEKLATELDNKRLIALEESAKKKTEIYTREYMGQDITNKKLLEKAIASDKKKIDAEYDLLKVGLNNTVTANKMSGEAINKEKTRIEGERVRAVQAEETKVRDIQISNQKKALETFKSVKEEQLTIYKDTIKQIEVLEEHRVSIIKNAEDRIRNLYLSAEEKKRELDRKLMTPEAQREDKLKEANEYLKKAEEERLKGTSESLARANTFAEKALSKFESVESKTTEQITETKNNIDIATGAIAKIVTQTKEIDLKRVDDSIEKQQKLAKVAFDNHVAAKLAALELEASLDKLTATKIINIDNKQALGKVDEVVTALASIRNKIIEIQVKELPAIPGKQMGGVIHAAMGRYLPGYGGGDRIPVMAEAGEYVHRKEATAFYGKPFMDAINTMRLPKMSAMSTGGNISSSDNRQYSKDSYILHYQNGGSVSAPPNIKSLMTQLSRELERESRRN